MTHLRGNVVDDWWSFAISDAEADEAGIPKEYRRPADSSPIRNHHNIVCGARRCRGQVAVSAKSLESLFFVTATAVRQSSTPGLAAWIYDLAAVVETDAEQQTVTYTFGTLRAALAYGKRKFWAFGS